MEVNSNICSSREQSQIHYKKKWGYFIGTVVVIVLILTPVTFLFKPKNDKENVQKYLDVSYGKRPHNIYDLFHPKDADKKDSLALILYVHGGSWVGGDKDCSERYDSTLTFYCKSYFGY